MSGTFYFFINHGLAMGFGHMGWGFENADGSCTFGSTEHKWDGNWSDPAAVQKAVQYVCIPAGAPNDFWMGHGTKIEMLDAMRGATGHFRYDEYKPVIIDNPNGGSAAVKARSQADAGWCIVFNNCLDHATAVAEAYGVGWNAVWPLPGGGPMPWKQTHPVPNDWFNTLLPGTQVSLQARDPAMTRGTYFAGVEFLQNARRAAEALTAQPSLIPNDGANPQDGALGFVMRMATVMSDGKSWDEAFKVYKTLA